MKTFSLVIALFTIATLFAGGVNSLHFYMDTSQEKCFVEELPRDTLVVGKYKIEQFIDSKKAYEENPVLGLQISVDDLTSKTRIKDHKGASSGGFSFTTSESASHLICFSTSRTGWFSHEQARVHLDLVIGDAAEDEQDSHAHEKLSELVGRVREMNHKIADIKKEQMYQREREAQFRDTSENANSKTVWWTLIQLVICGLTAAWQIRHLKGFFESKKLV